MQMFNNFIFKLVKDNFIKYFFNDDAQSC